MTATGVESWPATLGRTGYWTVCAWMWAAQSDEAFHFASFMTPERWGVSVTMVLDSDEGLTFNSNGSIDAVNSIDSDRDGSPDG